MIKHYFALIKPGIIFGNAVTAAGGFALASKGDVHWELLFAMLLGLSCIIGSACTLNNCMDVEIDAKMSRTQQRPLVKKIISIHQAIFFALLLGSFGSIELAFSTNLLTMNLALSGLFMYVVIYGISKYHTTYGTLIGSIAGAIPPLVGYCAVSNDLNMGALLLFLIIVFWQMPHFYAIAIYRKEDYARAKLPILPLIRGIKRTKIAMLLYTIAFICAALSLTLYGYTGSYYLVAILLFGGTWLALSIKGFWAPNDILWARQMFIFSLILVMTTSIMMSINSVA